MPTGPNDPASAYPPDEPSGAVLTSACPTASASGTFTLTPGDAGFQDVVITGGQIATGEDYWGVADSALPLAVTLVDGVLTYPEASADHVFDLGVRLTIFPASADIGKTVYFRLVGNDGMVETSGLVRDSGSSGFGFAALSCCDRLFLGDTGAHIIARVDVSELTQPFAQAGTVVHTIFQR